MTRVTSAPPAWPFYSPRASPKDQPELLLHDCDPTLPCSPPAAPGPGHCSAGGLGPAAHIYLCPASIPPAPVPSALFPLPRALSRPIASEQGSSSTHRSVLLPSGDRPRSWAPSLPLRSLPTPFPACRGSAVRSSPTLRDRQVVKARLRGGVWWRCWLWTRGRTWAEGHGSSTRVTSCCSHLLCDSSLLMLRPGRGVAPSRPWWYSL